MKLSESPKKKVDGAGGGVVGKRKWVIRNERWSGDLKEANMIKIHPMHICKSSLCIVNTLLIQYFLRFLQNLLLIASLLHTLNSPMSCIHVTLNNIIYMCFEFTWKAPTFIIHYHMKPFTLKELTSVCHLQNWPLSTHHLTSIRVIPLTCHLPSSVWEPLCSFTLPFMLFYFPSIWRT